MLNQAYSVLQVHSIDDENRVIFGMATTPKMNRMDQIVDPMGITSATEIPLLLYHSDEKPVGTAILSKPTKNGVSFQAKLPKVIEPGIVRDRVDEAWHSIKYKLIAAVSIGFRVVNDAMEFMKDGGVRFNEIEVVELSLVPVPANDQAVITGVHSIDRQLRAASGHTHKSVVRLITPGVSGKPDSAHRGSVQLIPR